MTDGQTAQTAAPHSGRQAGAFMGAVIVAHNDRCSDRAPGLRDRLAVVRNRHGPTPSRSSACGLSPARRSDFSSKETME